MKIYHLTIESIRAKISAITRHELKNEIVTYFHNTKAVIASITMKQVHTIPAITPGVRSLPLRRIKGGILSQSRVTNTFAGVELSPWMRWLFIVLLVAPRTTIS